MVPFIEPIKRRYIRNPNQEEFEQGKMLVYTGEAEETYDDKDFVPVEVKAGNHELTKFNYVENI